jgi:hypothetical protein
MRGMIRFEGTLTPKIYRRALGASGRSIRVIAWMLILASVVNFRFANLAQPVSWAMPLFIGTFGVMLLLAPRLTVKRAFATDRFCRSRSRATLMSRAFGWNPRTDVPICRGR